MPPNVDPDDLVDATGVAEILGFASRNVVSVYRKRHLDFPAPVVERSGGKTLLWLRTDIETWKAARS
jgi:predicted DNA-binding transcriptional regulator AlpA